MKDFIERKMFEIYNDLIKEVEKRDNLCDLRSLRFDNEKAPNYHNPLIQMLFLLRYLPAYMAEYYTIYSQIIDSNFLRNKLKVLSIGTGSGTDLWALYFATWNSFEEIEINYTGIDPVDWRYRENLGVKNCRFIYSDINNYRRLPENDYNLIIFPKSIGEFSDDEFNRLKEIFKRTNFIENRLVLVSTSRKAKKNEDKERIEKIKETINLSNFYTSINEVNYDSDISQQQGRLENYCQYFYYPEQIKNYITSLSMRCKQRDNCPDKNTDSDIFDRYPILRASQIFYQIYYLEKYDDIPF